MALSTAPAVVPLDTSAACQSVRRNEAIQSDCCVPEFVHALQHWYGDPAEHQWQDADQRWHKVPAESGLDQVCILAAAGFALATRAPCHEARHAIHPFSPSARIVAYLDDVCVCGLQGGVRTEGP